MNETIQKLKGISSILSMMTFQDEGTVYEWTPEAMGVLNHTLLGCIEELEKLNIE